MKEPTQPRNDKRIDQDKRPTNPRLQRIKELEEEIGKKKEKKAQVKKIIEKRQEKQKIEEEIKDLEYQEQHPTMYKIKKWIQNILG